MSELSSLSHEYANSALLAEKVNLAALRLRKAFSRAPGVERPSVETLRQAREEMAHIIRSILEELGKADLQEGTTQTAPERVPPEIIARIRDRHANQLPYFLDDAKGALRILDSDQPLRDDTFKVVDDVCDISDTSASDAFKRLWRR